MPTVTEGDPTTIEISLGSERYPVLVGSGLIGKAGNLIGRHTSLRGRKAAVVTDDTVGPLYAERVTAALRSAGIDPVLVTVPAGEASKSMDRATDVCREMLRAGLDRCAFLVALGGGVVGDLAGFAAAIFQRGIPCVQIPTTILAQVDSSVGGKTGVNTPEGKNLLGAFHQPTLVLADVGTLDTLPEREFREGFAEIIKHAAIREPSLLERVEARETIREHLVSLVTRNVAIKAAIVEQDERETADTRALLNFGHTLGHAIEAAGGYGRYLHGEAISLGLVAAAHLSVERAGLPAEEARRLVDCLERCELPTRLPAEVSDAAIFEALARDKKFDEGRIRFVLLERLGHAVVSPDITYRDLEEAVRHLR